jgi:hypothetical protein
VLARAPITDPFHAVLHDDVHIDLSTRGTPSDLDLTGTQWMAWQDLPSW